MGAQQTKEVKIKKIMIMAGGTGGHVIPALAVAQYLQEHGVAIHWIGTTAGIESRLVPLAGIPISYVDIKGIRGKKWQFYVLAPWRILKALLQSYLILLREQPQVVLSMGGYVAGPGAIAAWLLRCPLVLHEQNAVPGWTNRVLAKLARRIMVAFPNVLASIEKKVVHTGNPVRKEITTLPAPQDRLGERAKSSINILVLGGSQGALKLNEIVPQSIGLLLKDPNNVHTKLTLWHQTGKAHLAQTQANYAQYSASDLSVTVTDFIDDMAKAYAFADIVICRSGALTIAELAAVGVASILIPFPFAVDDHQTWNAKYLSENGAAFLLPQSSLTAQSLQSLLLTLIENPEKRLAMAMACRHLAKPMATAKVAELCLEVSCGA